MVARELEKAFRKARQQETVYRKTPETACEPEKLRAYFDAFFNSEPPGPTPEELVSPETACKFIGQLREISRENEIDCSVPTAEEIEKVLRKMRNGKAASDIPPELLKYGSYCPALVSELEKILAAIWGNPANVPKSWGESRLSTLYKNKGKRSDPSKYRPLSIGSSMCKLAVSLILGRINSWYNSQISEPQQGFRSNRGCQDAIYTLKRIHQINERAKKLVYAAFIDLTAAFDTVVRSWLFKSILDRLSPGQDPKCFTVLQELYKSTSAFLSQDPLKTTFATTSGVRQGGPESPPLFCLFMDTVMRQFEVECEAAGLHGVEINYQIPNSATSRQERSKQRASGKTSHLWVGFADDVSLFFETQSDLVAGLEILSKLPHRFGLRLSQGRSTSS